MRTYSKDIPTTPGAFSEVPSEGWLGKLSADGSKLIFGTYIADAFPRTHNVVLDRQGNIFIGTRITADGLKKLAGAKNLRRLTYFPVTDRVLKNLNEVGELSVLQVVNGDPAKITGDAGLPSHCGMGFWPGIFR